MEEIFSFVKKHIYLTLGVVFFAVICAVLSMSFYADREMQERGRIQFFENFARVTEDHVTDNDFDKNLVLGLAENMQGDSFSDRCKKIEQMGNRLSDTYRFFGVADKNGVVYTSTKNNYNFGDRDFFLALKNGEEVIETDSNNYTSDGKERILYMMASLKDANGNFDGAVFLAEKASESLDYIDGSFFNSELPVYLIRPDGQVVSYKGQQFLTDNLLKYFENYSADCKLAVEKIRKNIERGANGMIICDYDGGSTIAYYPVESIGREKEDYLVYVMSDTLLADGVNAAMSRLNKYLALGVIIIMLLVGYVLYIYLQMNAKIENLSYVSPITGGPNIAALHKMVMNENWTDFYLAVMDIDGYYKTMRHRNLQQMQNLMAKLWHNIDHEFVNEEVRLAYVHSHYFVFAIRKDHDSLGELFENITKSTIKFCQVNNVGVLYPHFGVMHVDNVNQDMTKDLGRIVSIVVSYDFDRINTNYVFCDEEKEVLEEHSGSLISYFEEAVNSHAFDLYYQPKWNRAGQVVGCKIVSSWKMEDGRVLAAEEFLGILSRQGLLPRLDMMNFRLACTQLRKWKEAGKKILPVSVFLSEASFYQDSLVNEYKLVTDVAGVSPKDIQIEISESSLVNVSNMEAIIKDFREAGFNIILGDFINGVSGLAKIPKNLIDYLSLGRVVDWVDTENGYVVCKGIVDMAKKIGLKVILSHINTEDRRKKIDEMDFDEVVGVYTGVPLTAEEFTKLLQQNEELL